MSAFAFRSVLAVERAYVPMAERTQKLVTISRLVSLTPKVTCNSPTQSRGASCIHVQSFLEAILKRFPDSRS